MTDSTLTSGANASNGVLPEGYAAAGRRFAIGRRGVAQALLDLLAWATALGLTTVFGNDLPTGVGVGGPPALMALVGAAAIPLGLAAGLYAGRWQFGSFEEVVALVWVTFGTGCAVVLGGYVLDLDIPLGTLVSVPPLGLVLMFATRFAWRLAIDRRSRPNGDGAERLLVFGAGRAGQQIVSSLLATRDSAFLPVAVLDDDPRKQHLRIKGVRVVGARNGLADAAARWRAQRILLALPTVPSATIRDLVRLAEEAGLAVSVLPDIQEIVSGRARLTDMREVTELDLLGRSSVQTDLPAIAQYVTGRRVLVTGAGGSIGSELCRQLSRLSPDRLIMLDRDESALHGVQLSIEGRALLESPNLVVADIRDRHRLRELFTTHRPHVVFHAAALKHLPLLEMHPSEAVKTNIWGTLYLLEEAERSGVETFVNISTDKAADPESVLGYSKRIAERATADVALRADRPYVSVRFGNVIGSRGSVLVTFRSQVEAGGPVTVTHPDVTRFFMTIEEAVQLVIQAGAIGHPGDVLILDMGEQVNIAEVARRLIGAGGRDIPIIFTGLRQGEKLHERLVGRDEVVRPAPHKMIMRTSAPPISARDIRAIDVTASDLPRVLAVVAREPGADVAIYLNRGLAGRP